MPSMSSWAQTPMVASMASLPLLSSLVIIAFFPASSCFKQRTHTHTQQQNIIVGTILGREFVNEPSPRCGCLLAPRDKRRRRVPSVYCTRRDCTRPPCERMKVDHGVGHAPPTRHLRRQILSLAWPAVFLYSFQPIPRNFDFSCVPLLPHTGRPPHIETPPSHRCTSSRVSALYTNRFAT